MTRYKIVLGDWSGDGHSLTETVYVEIPDIFWGSLLNENFNANVEKFGFNPIGGIASGYDDPTISVKQAERLFTAGFNNGWDEIEENGWLGHIHDKYNPPAGKMWVDGPEAYLEVLMFFIGHGLDGWSYEVVSDKTPLLVGGFSAIIDEREHAGYGLFIV